MFQDLYKTVTHGKTPKPCQYFFLHGEFDLQDVEHLLLVFIWDLDLDGELI